MAVQRFPRTAFSAPVDWDHMTGSVFRPGEGLSGGVYILTSSDDKPEIPKVVVKPVYGKSGLGTRETGEQMAFGDRAMAALLNIKTPISKVVNVGQAEYSKLLGLLRAHQPQRPTDPTQAGDWRDIGEAQSFVVMSEVPEGRSVSSFAEKAATDKTASNDLHRFVFDTGFIRQLARICVGDLLLGNEDRLAMGAVNLGNLMISGTGDAYAIDTNALLPGPNMADPSHVAKHGGAGGAFANNPRTDMDNPALRIEFFFEALINKMKAGDTGQAQEGAQPAWKMFEETYQAYKDTIAARFTEAYRTAALEIARHVDTQPGRQKMKGLTTGFAGTRGAKDLSYAGLKAQAIYIGARAKANNMSTSHERAGKEAGAYLAYRQLMAFDRTRLTVPNDRFALGAAGGLPAKARTAAIESLLPFRPADFVDLIGKVDRVKELTPFDQSWLDVLGRDVDAVRSELDSLGAKKRGLLGRKQPRNRQLAGNYVTGAILVGGAGVRAQYQLLLMANLVGRLHLLPDGQLGPTQVAQVTPVVQAVVAAVATTRTLATSYQNELGALSADVPTFALVGGSDKLGIALRKVQEAIARAERRLDPIEERVQPQQILDALRLTGR